MSYEDDFKRGYSIGSNPQLLQQYYEQQNREKYLKTLLGKEGVEAETLPPDVAGPVRPGVEGSGLLGNQMLPQEIAIGLMAAPSPSTRQVGGTLMNQMYAPQKPQNPTSTMQNLQAAGYQMGTDPYQQAMRDYMAKSGVSVKTIIGGPGSSRVWTDEEKDVADIPRADVIIENAKGDVKVLKSGDAQGAEDAGLVAVKDAYDTYRRLLEKHGSQLLPSASRLQMEAAYNGLLLEAKNLFELGVLAGPDMELMESVMIDPTSPRAKLYSDKAMLDQLEIFGNKLKSAREKHNEQYNITETDSEVNFEDL